MWSLRDVAETACAALREEDARLSLEQSPYGVDALDELAVHRLLRDAFTRASLGALAEQRYPAHASRPRRSEGDRCDIVLTPAPGQTIDEPSISSTLFASHALDPADALWIEVKIARQFSLAGGVVAPDQSYAAQLLTRATADVRRLATAEGLLHACVLTVQFTADAPVARHDLTAWLHRCVDLDLPVGAPFVCEAQIQDRLGNTTATVGLTPVRPITD